MANKKLTWVEQELTIKALDIPSLSSFSDDDYRELVNGDLVYVDHGEILRVSATGHPIATNVEQLEILLSELEKLKTRMVSRKDTKQ